MTAGCFVEPSMCYLHKFDWRTVCAVPVCLSQTAYILTSDLTSNTSLSSFPLTMEWIKYDIFAKAGTFVCDVFLL